MSERDDTHEDAPAERRHWATYTGLGLALTFMLFAIEGMLTGEQAPGARLPWLPVVRTGLLFLPLAITLFLLGKRITTGRYQPWLAFGVGAALPWILLIAFFMGPPALEYLGRHDFDAAAWRSAVEPPSGIGRSEIRIKMVDDLIASGILDGMYRKEVEALLGPDDGRGGGGAERYWLGPERGFISIDGEWLSIRYFDNDRVKDYRLITD